MKTKRIFTATVLAFLFLTGTLGLNAQQAPKKTPAKTSSTKTTAKKPVAKKKAVAKKSGNVFICDGVGGYFYHSRASCEILKKCKGKILNVPLQQAKGQFNCKPCKKCY